MNKFVLKTICAFIPVKKWRRAVKEHFRRKIDFKQTESNYKRKIEQLHGAEKVKIAFLMWENSKWSYEYIYKKFSQSPKYELEVLIVDKKHPLCNKEKNIEFYTSMGYHIRVIKSAKEIRKVAPDIIFYEQPWFALNNEYSPDLMSEFAICLYVTYDIGICLSKEVVDSCRGFFKSCEQVFVFSPKVADIFKKYGIENIAASGYPKLDVYTEPAKNKNVWKSVGKMRIIFAPHHSFKNSALKWATYEWSGEHIRQLALKYKDTTEWIFKPHPRFYLSLAKEFGEKYADKVFRDWNAVSTLYERGDYFDIFRSADLMISDCGSFRMEWLPTGKPYINLVSNYENQEPLSEEAKYYAAGYYNAHNTKELDEYFDMLINKKQDPKYEKRQKLLREIPMNVSENIYKYVENLQKK